MVIWQKHVPTVINSRMRAGGPPQPVGNDLPPG